MKRENKHEISKNLSFENKNYAGNIRKRVYECLASPDMTLKKLAADSGIPIATLNNLLYGNSTDCKLSTAIAIARTLGISIDELVCSGTIEDVVVQNMVAIRQLPKNSKYLIRWFINHQVTLYRNDRKYGKKIISVMKPLHTNDGILKVTNNFRQIDISRLADDIKNKVFFGLHLACEFYMPNYSPYDILLLANDRAPFPREHVVVLIKDDIFLVKQKILNGHSEFYGIRDGKYRTDESGVDEVIGYVTGIVPDTTEDGMR